MSGYPETSAFEPYPTYLRLMARRRGETLPPPTRAEYEDAQRILVDPWEDDLSNEALRAIEAWHMSNP